MILRTFYCDLSARSQHVTQIPIFLSMIARDSNTNFPQYDSTAKALEESRSEVDTWMSANSVLQALKTQVEEALEEKVKEILAYEQMVEELNGDVEVLKDDIAKANAFANAKDSELSGKFSNYLVLIL